MAALTIQIGGYSPLRIQAPDAPPCGTSRHDRIVSALHRAGVDPFAPEAELLASLRMLGSGRSVVLRRRPLLGSSVKVIKGLSKGVKTAVMYLAPHLDSGTNLCPWASPGCIKVCLKSSGHMALDMNGIVRLKKSLFYRLFRDQFMADLAEDIAKLERSAKRAGLVPAVRLNGTSDILWERTGIVAAFPNTTFYDYTKAPLGQRPNLPPNYHLTYSLSEAPDSMEHAQAWLDAGHNAAAVVSSVGGETRPDAARAAAYILAAGNWHGYPTTDGDETDVRFWDAGGQWVILYAKGDATRDDSGFVARVAMG